MRRKIENILLKMGIPVSVKGFNYIVDAVLIAYNNPNAKVTDIYKMIGENYNATSLSVERAIRHSFDIARKNRDENGTNEYINSMYLTNKESIWRLARIMKMEDENEESYD